MGLRIGLLARVAAVVTGPTVTIILLIVGAPGTAGDAVTWWEEWLPSVIAALGGWQLPFVAAWGVTVLGFIALAYSRRPPDQEQLASLTERVRSLEAEPGGRAAADLTLAAADLRERTDNLATVWTDHERRLAEAERRIGVLDRFQDDTSESFKAQLALIRGLQESVRSLLEMTEAQQGSGRALRHWLAAVARAQLAATRVVLVRALERDTPTLPERGEATEAHMLEMFSRAIGRHVDSIAASAAAAGMPEKGNVAVAAAAAAEAAEAELEREGSGRQLDAAAFGTLRRYRIACRQRAAVLAFLDRQRRLAEGEQEMALSGLITFLSAHGPKVGDS